MEIEKRNIFQISQNFHRGCDMNNGRQRLVEDWSGDDEDTSFFVELKGGDGDTHSQQYQWCRKCSAAGRMSGRERDSWSRSGYCDTLGCPGYSGHPPASRPQGEFSAEVTAVWIKSSFLYLDVKLICNKCCEF